MKLHLHLLSIFRILKLAGPNLFCDDFLPLGNRKSIQCNKLSYKGFLWKKLCQSHQISNELSFFTFLHWFEFQATWWWVMSDDPPSLPFPPKAYSRIALRSHDLLSQQKIYMSMERVFLKVILSSPCLWASFSPTIPLPHSLSEIPKVRKLY